MVRKTVISQLQSVGEGALGKLAQSPATRSAVQGAVQVKERGERLLGRSSRSRSGWRAIEKRLGALEKASAQASAATGAARRRRAPREPPPTRPRRAPSAGTRSRSAPGTISNRAGVVPSCSPSTSTGMGLVGVDAHPGAPHDLDAGMADVAAPVELRRGGDEVELAHVADQHDVEQAVVGLRVRRQLHPAAEEAAVGDDDVVHEARAARRRRSRHASRCCSSRRTHATSAE